MDERGASVAIVVVSYRSAALAIDCLRSIASERAASALSIRCVVVDNASGDAPAIAAAVAAEGWSGWATVITAPRNGGFAYGNNVGVRAAYAECRPDYVHLLNPDTVLRPGAIDALVRFLVAHPSAGVAGGIFENADLSEWAVAFRFPSLLGEMVQGLQWGAATRLFSRWQVPIHLGHQRRAVDWVSGASMMLRRELLDAIGGLDESFFLYFEETEFCFRAKAAGFEVWYVPESRVMHIAGQSTKVTERNQAPRRLPAYWFTSRTRYFVRAHGRGYAVLADVAAVLAGAIGTLKRVALSRAPVAAPHFLRDVLSHSLVWPRNWRDGSQAGVVPRF